MPIIVKRYSLAEFFYMMFAFLPVLFLIDNSKVAVFKAPIALLVLASCEFMLALLVRHCGLFNEFESFKQVFKVKSLGSDPRDEKSSELTCYIMYFLFYQFPLVASLFVLDACITEKAVFATSVAICSFIYNVTMLVFLIIRLKKMFDFIQETAEEDSKWAEVKWDVTKLIRNLTLDNHRLEFTPAYIKDISFMEFEKMICEEISKLKSYQDLDDEKKKIVLREAVSAAGMFEMQVCSSKYVELKWWIRTFGSFFIVLL